jgi:hypothetical protein
MIILLRGHIRNVFKNKNLYDVIKNIYTANNDVEIYIHTWDIIQNNISWRQVKMDATKVTEEMIKNYFDDLSFLIKHIIIDDDKKSKIHGTRNGRVSRSMMPMIGWKYYWFGQYQIIKYINEKIQDKNTCVVNFRFDVLDNSFHLNEEEIIQFIEKNKGNKFNKNVFAYESEKPGIDNIFIGNIKTQFDLINNFYFNLDQISINNKITYNQEYLAFWENNKLNCE